MSRWRVPSECDFAMVCNVITVAECAQMWQVCPQTIRRACASGAVLARQDVDGRWLILLPSALQWFGSPFVEVRITV